ncbi:hypothetical protein VNO77_28410 [Canavalia gladiata]|uniref:TIR domain-containing protein n=1 Tax=Canavalia gladiata TaxID=3824 RepID=A0AAN9L0B6_CANGL
MPFQFGITAKLHSWRSSLLRPFWALFGRRPSSNMSPLGQEGPPSMDSTTSGIPSSQHIYEYDVFISFRGTDIRNTFADHLYNHLIRKGLSVFKDDKKLHKGELISPQLIEAIQHSRVSIIVFSKDYASSAWCLEEMATIAECHRQFDQTVFPVFYDVDPSHVRNLNGVYENAFALHTEKYKHDLVPLHRWKKAMRDFGNSVGWDARNKPELWLYKDFYHVLTTEAESDNVEAIALDSKEDISKCCIEGLSKMRSLRMLILYHNKFSGSLKFLSNNLQYLLWHSYPFASLPTNFEPLYLVELNMPNSSVERLWEGPKDFPFLKRVDLNNSKNLTETPNFRGSPRLERLDFTGCTNLLQVHSSIGLLSKLVFLSLRNCNNLVEVDFGYVIILSNLIVLHLSGCTQLKSTPDFTGILNLEYLDIDGCTSLSKVHESIGALTKLRFLSLRDCTELAYFPLIPSTSSSSSHLKSLIYMDLSFCNLLKVPDAIGQLVCLERLNLQGNKFVYLPYTIVELSCLAYLNLAHCHELSSFCLSTESASPVGRYFKTASGSRDHRSGLYAFDCPRVEKDPLIQFIWLERLLKQPHHFRCGFDIVLPSDGSSIDSDFNFHLQRWFDDIFRGDSIIRVVHCNVDDNWIGFAFFAEFETENLSTSSDSPHHSSSSQLPHPFYLSFESEWVEERFDMPLNLELDKIDGSHSWTIYISREHCHFIKTGAHITFKARPGLVVKNWGLRRIVKQDIDMLERQRLEPSHKDNLVISNVEKSSTSSGHKIQLPYNWLISEEDEVENLEAKAKENNLCNRGL